MVKLDLLKNQLLVLGDLQTEQFEVKVEVGNWLSRWFVVLEVQSLHVRVRQGLVNGDATVRVESQHLFNQINRLLVGAAEQLIEIFTAIEWQLSHESAVVRILDLVNEVGFWLSHQIGYHHHLFLLRLSGQQWLPSNEFSENTANAPNINGRRVLPPRENHFRSSIPARCDVVGERGLRGHQRVNIGARQSKVANFEVAVAVDEQVAGLQVAMEDTARVDVLKASQNLVQEELNVLVAEHLIGFNDLSQVGFHQVRHDVQLIEILQRTWLQNAFDREHVFVVEESHDFQLAQRPQRENLVLESLFDFFDGNQVLSFVLNRVILGSHHHAIRARAHRLQNIVPRW